MERTFTATLRPIAAVLEALGVGLVIPVVALMTQGDLGSRYPALVPWLSRLGNPSQEWLVVAAMLTLAGVYAIKVLFLGFLTWRQMSFVFGVQAEFSQRLFREYLRQPYTFHLQHNSAKLIRNAIQEINVFTGCGIIGGMAFLTEIFVLVCISALLLTVEPLGGLLVMSLFGLAIWGFNRVTRSHVLSWRRRFQQLRADGGIRGAGSERLRTGPDVQDPVRFHGDPSRAGRRGR